MRHCRLLSALIRPGSKVALILCTIGFVLLLLTPQPLTKIGTNDLRNAATIKQRVSASSPSFMFTTNNQDAQGVLRKYFTSRDYISLNIARENPELANLIPRSHIYVLPTHLGYTWLGNPGVARWVENGCGEGIPGLILYDPEHWEGTPKEEQEHLAEAISTGASLAHSTGCHSFGVAPDGVFMLGIDPDNCSYDLEQGVYKDVNWAQIDFVDIQAQRLLSDDCAKEWTVQDYAKVVSQVSKYIRSENPEIVIASQVSFRYTPSGKMIAAIKKAANTIDVVYLAYPINNQTIPCEYCSPKQLENVLRYFR